MIAGSEARCLDENPAFARGFSSAIYAAPSRIAAGAALPLAGGWLGFGGCRLMARRPAGGRTSVDVSLSVARDWAERTGTDAAFSAWLSRVTLPRSSLAGLDLATPRLMGVVNVTPDSFYDGGRYADAAAAIAHGRRLADEHADILDVGGESTRPGAEPVALETEAARVLPVVEGLAPRAPVSIDSRKAVVIRRALAAGARIVNDVTALSGDPDSIAAVATSDCPVVLMHAQGDPRTMQLAPHYDDALLDVFDYLAARLAACEAAGISRRRLVVDPGIGFGKNDAHNLDLLRGVALFHALGCAVLVGVSRKSLIGRLAGAAKADDRLPGSLALAAWLVSQGVQVVRVHDVAATRQALALWRRVAE